MLGATISTDAPFHPHLLYPQFKQVAQPSMITSALVLHLWHRVALGGKVAPSPVISMSSGWLAALLMTSPPARLKASTFFFWLCS